MSATAAMAFVVSAGDGPQVSRCGLQCAPDDVVAVALVIHNSGESDTPLQGGAYLVAIAC